MPSLARLAQRCSRHRQSARILSRVGADEFVGDELAFRSSMLERFGPNGSEDGLVGPVEPFAREMLAAYRAYWRAALAKPDERLPRKRISCPRCGG
jgi:hypothetical protein